MSSVVGTVGTVSSTGLENASPKPRAKVKQGKQARHWMFRLSNWTEQDIKKILETSRYKVPVLIFQTEDTGNNPHIQGWLSGRKKLRWSELGWNKETHFNQHDTKRFPNKDLGRSYCCKEESYTGEHRYIIGWKKPIQIDLTLPDLPELKAWQQKIADMVSEEPPNWNRKIHWFVGDGNMGMTMLCRYLVLKEQAIYLQGARRHILAVAWKNPSKIYIIGLERSEMDISYTSLEALSDGLYMTGFGTNATSNMTPRKSPWVLVFSNWAPERSACSSDRWDVTKLTELIEECQREKVSELFPIRVVGNLRRSKRLLHK